MDLEKGKFSYERFSSCFDFCSSVNADAISGPRMPSVQARSGAAGGRRGPRPRRGPRSRRPSSGAARAGGAALPLSVQAACSEPWLRRGPPPAGHLPPGPAATPGPPRLPLQPRPAARVRPESAWAGAPQSAFAEALWVTLGAPRFETLILGCEERDRGPLLWRVTRSAHGQLSAS